ncbi:GMC oxidoreductase [Glonium stellatum]|uniref:GMC oxidoreductase n=1 Tax=Glonium stellatum TaxID=574774 RepID=A0A8E2ENS7_9PEZI|nr:GMC oxidoreductase [Glonium stellatum]
MRSLLYVALAVELSSVLVSSAVALSAHTCSAVCDEDIREKTYDYIVVGGGVTGLVVANRLTEDGHSTVLVIERGYFDNSPRAIVPYWAHGLDTSVMINPTSAPVANLNNATFPVPVAAVVGGGSVVNGMDYMRGSQVDYDAWEELGNPGWGWDGLLPYFRKSATLIPPSPEVAEQWNMTWDLSVYGHGPLYVTIPNFQYADTAYFWDAWKRENGVTLRKDVAAGSGPGVYWTVSTIDARDQTRATSRKEYYDPVYLERSNLHLVTGQIVSEILFEYLSATGVRIVSRADNSTAEVYASKEVILAAGAVQTPQLLQISGIGPKDVLNAAGIKVKKDMPAVGANLQDHATVQMTYNLSYQSFPNPDTIANNETYNATVWAEYWANRTGPIAAGTSSFSASLSLPQLTSLAGSIARKLIAQKPAQYLPSVYGFGPLLQGFKAQRKILAERFTSNSSVIAQFPVPGNGFAFTPLQKPLSRGTITLNPTNPQGLPIIQFNTLMNPIDVDIIVAMVKHNRAFWKKPELTPLGPVEAAPGAQYQTDDEIIFALTKKGFLSPTLAHPCGTCAMMPEELGGCVGPDLRVFGIQNLSVIDASILPMIPATTLQATMYAIGEKAADLIKARA